MILSRTLPLFLLCACAAAVREPLAQEPSSFARKLSPELRDHLDASRNTVVFGVWLDDQGLGERSLALTFEATNDLGPRDVKRADRILGERLSWFARRLEQDVLAPFLARAREQGATIERRIALAPVVELRATPETIEELSQWPCVLSLYLPHESLPEAETAIGTIRAREIPGLPIASMGAGVPVGMCDAAHPKDVHPHLPPLTGLQSYPHGAHATAVAGMIASNDPSTRGVSPGILELLSKPGITSVGDVLQAGAQVVNVSLYDGTTDRTVHAYDRLYDYWIRSTGRLIVKSAGNQGLAGGAVTTPGKGWNTFAIGNLADAATTAWSDDAIHPSSSYLDPSSGAPKPELSAPGTQLPGLLPSSPWTSANVGTGTSYAAPHVVGTIALLLSEDTRLQWKPAALRALLMATAWNEFESPAPFTDRGGSGGLNARAAWNVLHAPSSDGRFFSGVFSPSSFDSRNAWETRVHLEANNATRLVLHWLAQASGSAPQYRPHGLDAVLEVEVIDPLGTTWRAPSWPAAAFRILRFLPRGTGLHTVRVTYTRYDGYLEPFGLAVSQRFDASTAEVRVTRGSMRLGETTELEGFDPYVVDGFGLLLPTLTGIGYGTGIAIGERTLPIVDDGLWSVALQPGNGVFEGLAGSRSARAFVRGRIHLPNDPALLSLPPLGLTFGAFDRRGELESVAPPLLLAPMR